MSETYENEARKIGTELGTNAASWVELDEQTAQKINEDPYEGLADFFSGPGPLSGEWADGYSVDQLLEDVGSEPYTEAQLDDSENYQRDYIANAYEEAYWQAFETEVLRKVENMRGPALDLDLDATYRVEGRTRVAVRLVGQTFGGRARVVMVGDDQEHVVEPGDLVKIDDEDYCHECGQVGCTADGRDRT